MPATLADLRRAARACHLEIVRAKCQLNGAAAYQLRNVGALRRRPTIYTLADLRRHFG